MKLVALEFQAFGHFSNVRLDFGEDGKQFHLIYGNNEAGKSTALRGLTNLFYGIPARTTDIFRHDGPSLRIAAELLRANGERLACVRRKGNQKTLLNREGEPLSDQVLSPYLGGLSEEAFTTIYRLDHETLVRGGEELKEGRGDLAESLFQAGAGITGLRQTLKGLEDEADRIFKPRAQNPLINRAIETYQSAKKRSKELSVRPADWKTKQEELANTVEELGRKQQKLAELQKNAKRLDRLRLAWPHAARLRIIRAEIAALGEYVPLHEGFSQERVDAERREREGRARLDQAQNKTARIQSEIENMQAPEELLQQAPAITSLNQRLGRYQQVLVELPKVRAEAKRDQADAGEILQSLRPDGGDSGGAFHLTILSREHIETLANRHAALQQRAADTAKRRNEAAEELAQWQALLSPDAPVSDPVKLRQVLSRVQKDGDLEAALRELETKLRLHEEQAQRELARLGRWTGTGETLEQTAFPSSETVERFENDFARAEQAHRDALQQLEQAREKLRQAETRIQALQREGEVPTERELEIKREQRDAGWRLIRRAWQEGVADEKEGPAFHPDKPLAEAYEEAVAEADLVADRLRREAKRVGQLAELLATRDDNRERVVHAEVAVEKTRVTLQDLQDAWLLEWKATGVEPASPREMRAWLSQCTSVRRMLDDTRHQRIAVDQGRALIESRSAELREELSAFGEKTAPNVSLGALIDCASTLLESMEEARSRREAHEAEIKRRTLAVHKAEREADTAAGELRVWCKEWSEAVASLALAQEPSASQALAVLRQIERHQQKVKLAAEGLARAGVLEHEIEQFKNDVAIIVNAVAPDLCGVALEQAAGQLQVRLMQAQKNAAQRQTLRKQLLQEQDQIEVSAAEIRGAQDDLQRLFARARCGTREEVIAAEEKAAKGRVLERESEELLRALAPLSGGLPMEEFLAQLDGVHLDELSAETDLLSRQVSECEDAIGNLQTTRGKQQTELSAMDGGELAAEASDEAQQAAAEIESLSARYLRLRLASGILRRQIEYYREENQGPVIRRASELFPRLTRESFSGLKTGFDEKDRPVLLGLRSSGEEVPVAGMSEGTRDQLFLALRLASLERQMEGSEPVPFVLDDILISFDNDRARDTLRVLAELCTRTQVLFFTHHEHLLDIAQEAVSKELLRIHTLGRNAGESL